MNEKKHTYESAIAGLPPLKMVLGDVPNPDGDSRRPFRPFPFITEKPEAEATVKKLIGFIQDTK